MAEVPKGNVGRAAAGLSPKYDRRDPSCGQPLAHAAELLGGGVQQPGVGLAQVVAAQLLLQAETRQSQQRRSAGLVAL